MTGALLDFGTSFWASDLVRSEFPGLRSSSFRPIGRFGIGFYSIFMIASEVVVASRRFDEGLSDVTRLYFANGLTLRPILSKGVDTNCDVMSSTSVRLTVNESIECITTRCINKGQPQNERQIPIKSYLAAITAGLDVAVALQIGDAAPVTVHESIDSLDTPEKVLDWIEGIAFVDVPSVNAAPEAKKYVRENAGRIRRIEHNGELLGFAALLDVPGDGLQCLTTDVIGGLTNNVLRGSGNYLGYMESHPASARRDAAKRIAPTAVLQAWANEQVAMLVEKNASPVQLYWAASNMANLEVDPIDIIHFPVFFTNTQCALLTFDQVFNLLQQTPIGCLTVRQTEFADTNLQPILIDGRPTLRPLHGGNLIRVSMENGKPKYPLSLIGLLDRLVARRGRELAYETKPVPLQTIFSPLDALTFKLKGT
jgi:hypothetical protein